MLKNAMPEAVQWTGSDDSPQDHWRLLWPSMSFVLDRLKSRAAAAASSGCSVHTTMVMDVKSHTADSQESTANAEDESFEHRQSREVMRLLRSAGHLFFLPQQLMQMPPDVLSQLFTYENRSPHHQQHHHREEANHNLLIGIPHIKSYFRMMSSETLPVDTSSSSSSSWSSSSLSSSPVQCLASHRSDAAGCILTCTCTPVAWYLLTSACLSKGDESAVTSLYCMYVMLLMINCILFVRCSRRRIRTSSVSSMLLCASGT